MTLTNLDKRLSKLEGKHMISTLADYAIWCAHGCPDGYTWDPELRAFLLEYAQKFIEAEQDKTMKEVD